MFRVKQHGRSTLLYFFVGFLSFMLARPAMAEFDYASYQPYTIKKAISDHPHDPRLDYLIEAGNFKYLVQVTYVGKTRTIRQGVKDLLIKWGKGLRKDPSFVALFKHEILVREGSNAFWIPIQEPLLPSVSEELTPGSTVGLYIFRIGSTKTDWVFVINEFQLISGPKQ